MPYILTRRERTSQPQQAVQVNWSNPLAKTITQCIPLNGVDIDIVSGNALTYGTGGSKVVDERGVSLKGNGSAAVASIPLNLSAYNKLTLSFWMYWDSFSNDDKLAMELTTDTNWNVGGFLIDPNASSGKFVAYSLLEAGHGCGTEVIRPSDGVWHHYVITMDRTAPNNASGNFSNIWIDGVYKTPYELYSYHEVGTFANSTLYIMSRANSSLFGAGKLQNIIFRGGYIATEQDVIAEYENPWQIFDDEEDYIWIPEAGGGVSNIAASGTVQASGTASPAVAVAMSGVGASLSSGTAADRVTVNIGAAGLATAAATAGISAQVLLAGAAAALASGNATLAATLNALAAGAAQSSGTATINSGVAGALAAVGTDVVSGSAPIRVTVSLGASGSDAVGGSAAIVGSPISPLSGAGVDVVSGSGAAVINVSLSAAGFVQAMAAGQLSMQVRLSSTGASVVSGVAGITSLGVTVDAPNGYGPKIIRPKTRRPANLGGIIF